jgi:hypothetical protein
MKMRQFNTRAQKLSTVQVKELYNRLLEGETQGSLAREYGLSVVQVGRIARGESRAQETGAGGNPVPNHQLSDHGFDQAASLARLNSLLKEATDLKAAEGREDSMLDELVNKDKGDSQSE